MMKQQGTHLEIILDMCVTAVWEHGQSVTACLAQYPDYKDVLEPLLHTGLQLQAAGAVRPSPEFRQAAPVRMQNLLAAHPRRQPQRSTSPPRVPWWKKLTRQRRLAWAGALGLFLVFWLFVGSTLAVAATDALPGERLYPVKQAVESTRLALTTNPVNEALLHLTFAERRLAEAEQLAAAGNTAVIPQTLQAYEEEVTAVLDSLENGTTLTPAQQEIVAPVIAEALSRHEEKFNNWTQGGVEETAVAKARQLSHAGILQALLILGQPPEELLPGTPATATPSQTPLPTPTATHTATATPTATSTATATPQPTTTPTPHWLIPPNWPEGCPLPPDWPEEWPPDCPILPIWPPGWPTPPGGWPQPTPRPTMPPLPTIPPLPTFEVPPDWPEECPVPPDLPEEWPENCPLPTDWPESWPTPPGGWILPRDWPTPPPGDEWQSLPGVPTRPPNLPNPSDIPRPPRPLRP